MFYTIKLVAKSTLEISLHFTLLHVKLNRKINLMHLISYGKSEWCRTPPPQKIYI